MKWTGPYLVVTKLSDVVYRIQQSERCKPKVVHLDRLKSYDGPPLETWLRRRNPVRPRCVPGRYRD